MHVNESLPLAAPHCIGKDISFKHCPVVAFFVGGVLFVWFGEQQCKNCLTIDSIDCNPQRGSTWSTQLKDEIKLQEKFQKFRLLFLVHTFRGQCNHSNLPHSILKPLPVDPASHAWSEANDTALVSAQPVALQHILKYLLPTLLL